MGGKLSDFQGQIRYLRIEPFSRPDFWKNNIDDPYKKGNLESLRVLRSLLSRIVCRYSKDQMHSDGTTPLLSLPPRTVETVVLTFGSKEEEDFYKHLDSNNRTIFRKLKHNSAATVAESYMALSGLLLAARQACCHVSLVSLAKIDRYNRIKDQRKKDLGITEIPRDLQFRPGEEKTRAGLLKLAMHRARATAKNRMMTVLSQYQVSGVLLECPVCFDCTEESELAIPGKTVSMSVFVAWNENQHFELMSTLTP